MKRAVILVNPYLSEDSEFYQPRRIAEELRARGVKTDILQNAYLSHISQDGICTTFGAPDFAVYLDKDKYLPRMLEKQGLRLFNPADAVETCDDKMLTHIALSGVVPMPETYPAPLCYKSAATAQSPALHFPVVVKECYGSFGAQVFLAHDREELDSLLQTLKLRPHLLQRFVAESAGRDVRALCIGGEIVACMLRTSRGDFRSNAALGGKGEPYPADESLRALCKTVCKTLRLDYCGIDLLLGKDGYLVCEVNSNAFFGAIERVTGVNVAGNYAEYLVKTVYGSAF